MIGKPVFDRPSMASDCNCQHQGTPVKYLLV